MRILFFGTYDAGRHPRIRVLRQGLHRLGENVIECNQPWTASTATRLKVLRKPWLVPIAGAHVAWIWSQLYRQARRIPRPDAVIVGYMGHFDIHLARRIWPDRPILLDYLVSLRDTASDRRLRSRTLAWILDRIDQSALGSTDLAIVDTREHLELLDPEVQAQALIVPVGFTDEWFTSAPRLSKVPIKAIFFGLFTPLQGTAVIGKAMARLATEPIHFTMVGSGQDLARTQAEASSNRHVQWIDWVEAERLPSVVAEHDVCLGIFGTTAKSRRVVPNKVFQGAAAGCVIVTSDTPPQRRALGEAAIFVEPGNAAALADAISRLARDTNRLEALRRQSQARAQAYFRPEVIAAPLHDRLKHFLRP